MRRALITGITGQTGGYLCEHLLETGWEVHGLVRDADDLEPAFHERSPAALLHSGDLAHRDNVRAVLDAVQPAVVFNLGGISSVAESWERPEATGRITGVAVATIAEWAWERRDSAEHPPALVQASSAEIFGHAADVPQRESTLIKPVSPYGAAKAYAHTIVQLYRDRGLHASNGILYNHESPRRPPAFVTRKITMGAARIALGLQSELVLGNLDSQRDWGWAPDYARALAALAGGDAGDYVIATGEPHSVRDFVDAAFRAAGIDDWQPFIRQDPRFMRPNDAPTLLGDPTHIRETLGWQPTVTFDELVARMVQADLELARSLAS